MIYAIQMKDFNEWSKQKSAIHENEKNKWCNERDIWWCRLGVNIGYEQDSKGEDSLRPVLVIKKFNEFVCLVVPLSTKDKKGKYYKSFVNVHGLSVVAVISQLRLVDTKRLFKRDSKINEKDFVKIRKAIMELFA